MILPIILMLLAIFSKGYDGDMPNNILIFVVFPLLILPIIALLYQIGSIHLKELLLTYPLHNFIFGWVRPITLSIIYAATFIVSLTLTNHYTFEELIAAFISSLFYMILTAFFLILFKNVAMGVALPLAYLFYGMFTTGTGQGYFYLLQWSRANPDISLYDCIIVQGIAALGFSLWGVYLLKHRNKYHWSL